jgi:hypothetical protein
MASPTCLLAGEIVPVDQDHVPRPLLQMQGDADADHTGTQGHNVGLQFCHPALRKFNVTRLLLLLNVRLIIAASRRKPVYPGGITLARRLNSGNMERR